jgi:hypothetical protein
MKSTIQLFTIFLLTWILSSCRSGANSISEVMLIPVQSGEEFQYINKEGKIVINPQFSMATVFRDGLALVRTSGDNPKWGFISEDGKYVIGANYKSATVFSEGLAWVVSENSAPTAINKKGEVKVTLQDAETVNIFKEGLSAFSVISDLDVDADSSQVKWGFVDKEGKVKITPQFKSTRNFSNGKCAIENKDGKWGYIDQDGKISINYQFERALDFVDGKAIVVAGAKFGVIDESGKYIINPQYTQMSYDGDKYLIEQDQKWGWCDMEGKIIINPQFEIAMPFVGNNLAAVKSGASWGYIDIEGKIVINPQFELAIPFNGKHAFVISNGKFGLIDTDGKYVINPQFKNISGDFYSYIMLGSAGELESVETDFFNITSIVKRINVNVPEGLTMTSKLTDVITKLNITENEFYQYTTDHLVIKNEKLTKDASISFYVIADAFKETTVGWYSQKVFNAESIVQGYAYVVSLAGKGYNKEIIVKDAIEKSFTGYQKDDIQSNESMSIFKYKKQIIKTYMNGNQIIIYISNDLNGTVQYPKILEEQNYSDYSGIDSVAVDTAYVN